MPIDTELSKLHRQPINVWVEDELSSEYLAETWIEPRALFLIAGSCDSIRPVVAHACRNGAGNVFGVIDRDFEESNSARWANPTLRVFVLPVHEMENYLLDADALAGCDVSNRGRTAAQIDANMGQHAQSLLLWMTTCSVIKRFRRTCLDNFLERPAIAGISTLPQIWSYLQQSPWYQAFAGHAAGINSEATVKQWITETHTALTADLNNGTWKRSFSGKEILRRVRDYVYQPPRPALPGRYDIDLAQAVTRWQVVSGQVPADLANILTHVRIKTGL